MTRDPRVPAKKLGVPCAWRLPHFNILLLQPPLRVRLEASNSGRPHPVCVTTLMQTLSKARSPTARQGSRGLLYKLYRASSSGPHPPTHNSLGRETSTPEHFEQHPLSKKSFCTGTNETWAVSNSSEMVQRPWGEGNQLNDLSRSLHWGLEIYRISIRPHLVTGDEAAFQKWEKD